jgi:hypothetical protein
MVYDVVSAEQNFRGLSYGHWVARWSNWLLSDQRYYQNSDDILFLRGNVAWIPSGGQGGQLRIIDPNGFYDRGGRLGEKIFDETAVFIPVITAMYFIGDRYDGQVLENEEQIRYAARNDINQGGPMYTTIQTPPPQQQQQPENLVADLKTYFVETPMFKLIVSERCPLLEFLEYPMTPGIFDAVTVGYFLIVKALTAPKTYRIQFGGKGRGYYFTDSVYDITVTPQDKSHDFVRDISPTAPGTPPRAYPPLPYKFDIPDHGP